MGKALNAAASWKFIRVASAGRRVPLRVKKTSLLQQSKPQPIVSPVPKLLCLAQSASCTHEHRVFSQAFAAVSGQGAVGQSLRKLRSPALITLAGGGAAMEEQPIAGVPYGARDETRSSIHHVSVSKPNRHQRTC